MERYLKKSIAEVMSDYRALAGKIVLLDGVSGYRYRQGVPHSVDVEFEEPRAFKVLKGADREEILNINAYWIDPHYRVTPLRRYPEIKGMRSFWCYGPWSYNTETGKKQRGDIVGRAKVTRK